MTVFVILHYLNYEVTHKAVQAIVDNNFSDEYAIVVVDNGSKNGTGERLRSALSKYPFCKVLILEDNLGFARGNNEGYKYAKDTFNPDYIVVMNNDLFISDNETIKKIMNCYNQYHFHIMGPDIYSTLSKSHQNPMRQNTFSLDEINATIRALKRNLHINMATYYLFRYTYGTILNLYNANRRKTGKIMDHTKRQKNVVLHGACLVFSRLFIECEHNAFCPDTFLYYEEDILFQYCMNKKYVIIYEPSIKVEHLEDVSTNTENKSKYKKYIFRTKHLLHSANVFKRILESDSTN